MSQTTVFETVPFTTVQATNLCALEVQQLGVYLPRTPRYFFLNVTIYDGDLVVKCPSQVYTRVRQRVMWVVCV